MIYVKAEKFRINFEVKMVVCCLPESNWRPTDYESVALPTEPRQHIKADFKKI